MKKKKIKNGKRVKKKTCNNKAEKAKRSKLYADREAVYAARRLESTENDAAELAMAMSLLGRTKTRRGE